MSTSDKASSRDQSVQDASSTELQGAISSLHEAIEFCRENHMTWCTVQLRPAEANALSAVLAAFTVPPGEEAASSIVEQLTDLASQVRLDIDQGTWMRPLWGDEPLPPSGTFGTIESTYGPSVETSFMRLASRFVRSVITGQGSAAALASKETR